MSNLTQKRVFMNNAMHGLVPVEIYLLSDGSLVFARSFGAVPTYEHCPDGVSSMFDAEGFTLWEPGSAEYRYEYETVYRYKVMPLMRGWLSQQDLDKSQLVKETK